MKRYLFSTFGFLLLLHTVALSKPLIRADSLPAGTQINLEIFLPGDATATRLRYTVPAPKVVEPPKPVDPSTITLTDGMVIGKRGQAQLVVRLFEGKRYLTEVLPGGQMLIRGPNLLKRDDVESAYKARYTEFVGGATAFDGFTEPAGVKTPTGYVRKTFPDGAVYYVVGDPDQNDPEPKPSDPAKPDRPTPQPDSQTPTGSAQAKRYPTPFQYSDQPNRVNRMQSPVQAPYQDGWAMKQSEVIVGGNGGIVETPEELRKRGHNWFNALWFYGDNARKGFGLPRKDDNLFFEYTGNFWKPYHQDSYLSIVTDLTQIANESLARMPIWNSVPENGLIDGVATVKEGHFNIEYNYATDDQYARWSDEQKNRSFFNYAIGRSETIRECYQRGGVRALQDAQLQKWRNIVYISIQYLNAKNNGMKAYLGDMHGIAPIHSLKDWNLPYSADDLLRSDVNDGGKFAEANEFANAGPVTIFNGETYTVTGNVRALARRSHCYSYETYLFARTVDFAEYFSVGKDAPADRRNINNWLGKLQPNLYRPYDIAFHATLTDKVKREKGWTDYKVYWQAETIYEFDILLPDQGWRVGNGAWVPWTLGNGRATKIPLHPEVAATLTFLSRLHYDGKFLWGSYALVDPDAGKGENVHPAVHLVSREAEQAALNELGQFNTSVFLADKRQHLTDIPVQNPANGGWVSGGPHKLLYANGNPAKPAPLVTGVDSPSSGWELYLVYYPHASRDGQTEVRWKSPVDGAELSGTAYGWGATLYARKRPTDR